MTKWCSSKTLKNTKTDGEKVIPFNSFLIPDYYKKKVLGQPYTVFIALSSEFLQITAGGQNSVPVFQLSIDIASTSLFWEGYISYPFMTGIYIKLSFQIQVSNSIVGTDCLKFGVTRPETSSNL